ncbi:MAG: ribosome silencing factor [Clostridia bacterium]|nr:ribosome silencing factor [Clostridia bacterium]
METEKIYEIVMDALEEKKALDITAIDVKKITSLTDYFVIATGTSDRHRKSLADEVEDKVEKAGYQIVSKEGYEKANWILLDYGDIVISIFDKETRSKFNLERLWSDGILSEIRNK